MPCPAIQYFVGVDLGRDRDHSAIAVMALRSDHTGLALRLGALQRVPLGTGYIEVIQRLLHVVATLGCMAGRIHVVVDSAGPGQVVVELIREKRLDIRLVAALLSGGRETGRSPSGAVTVPRRELMTNLRRLLESRAIRIPRNLAHIRELEVEIAAVRPEGGQYAHDDLVVAVGLAAWQAVRAYPRLLEVDLAA
ncbi:MAG: hypothetical protein ACKV2U_25910 [Bryobacteraceae bacterium]